MSHSVRKHLKLDIEAYDGTIRRFIPGYEEMIATAADAVASVSPAHVLDLGGGTGALAAALLERTSATVVELIDVDNEMLTRARIRLVECRERARFSQQDFFEELPSCDAVMASLALHHVPTLKAKTELFTRIHECLAPGGILVNADVTVPDDDAQRTAAYKTWADHLVAHRITRADAKAHFERWADEDTYFSLEEELAALSKAGFEAKCVWQQDVSTVVVGTKR